MTFNNLIGAVSIVSLLTMYASLGILLLSLDKTLGTIVIVSFIVKAIARAIYLHNEIKERIEQVNNLMNSLSQPALNVDNVIKLKKDDK